MCIRDSPYTLQPVFTAKSPKEKLAQRKYFFWYLQENKSDIISSLKRIGRLDLIDKLYPNQSSYCANKPRRAVVAHNKSRKNSKNKK